MRADLWKTRIRHLAHQVIDATTQNPGRVGVVPMSEFYDVERDVALFLALLPPGTACERSPFDEALLVRRIN